MVKDQDFISAIFEPNFNFTKEVHPCMPSDLMFHPVDEHPENVARSINPGADPDTNYYNNVKVCSRKYMCADEIAIRSEWTNQSFSIIYLNGRSLQYKVPDVAYHWIKQRH